MASVEIVKSIPGVLQPGIIRYLQPYQIDLTTEQIQARARLFTDGSTEEDHRIAKAYEALAEGRTLISLRDTLKKAGMVQVGRSDHLPGLAIAPAQCGGVHVRSTEDGSVTFIAALPGVKTKRFGLSETTPWTMTLTQLYHSWIPSYGTFRQEADTVTPYIPPLLRPDDLSQYLLLWEAHWIPVSYEPPPAPRHADPALLEPIVGDLYVVHAAWELTDLEAKALL